MITFQVSKVKRAAAPLEIPAPGTSLRLQDRAVEAMGAGAPFLPSHGNALLHAAGLTYSDHRPLVLSPDVIWLAIAQGFALHVNQNAERLRGKFVRHEGQATISIERHDFVKGSPHNPWPEVFGAFSREIAKHIGRQRDLVVCDFSTTGPIERAASEVVLLDAMQRYFDFTMLTMCGIPEITLEGTADDWRSIRRRARALEEYELDWWTKALGPVLDKLVDTAEGRVDVPFWETLFKPDGGSGGPYVRGWINVLFPYLRRGEEQELVRNPYLSKWREGLDASFGGGPSDSDIPSGLSSAPFLWKYFEEELPMRFLGGFVGVGQDEATLAVRPVIGWAVRSDAPAKPAVHSLALIAGSVTSQQEMTVAQMEATIARIEALGPELGVPLACAPCGDFRKAAAYPDAEVRCFFAVGVRLCADGPCSRADVDAALEAARGISLPAWSKIMEGLTGYVSAAVELHLVAAGERIAGELRVGREGGGVVAGVTAPMVCWKTVPVAALVGSEYWLVER